MEYSLFLHFILAILLGAVIGIERDMSSAHVKVNGTGIGGLRSYALISLFGAIMVWLDQFMDPAIWTIMWFLVSGIFLMISYVYAAFYRNRMGITSEYAAFLTYIIGATVMMGATTLAVIVTILILILLSSKERFHLISSKISREEMNNSIKFAVIALVILPLLPDVRYSLNEILSVLVWQDLWLTHPILTMSFINPFSIWLFVVIMVGVEYVGYILSKLLWNRGGVVLSGAIGGMISSTAVTAAMTTKSHDGSSNTTAYIAATLIASMIMCVRVIIVSAFYNPAMLATITIPSLAILLWLWGSVLYYYYKDKRANVKHVVEAQEYESPFRIIPAIQFALIIVAVKFIAGIGLIYESVIDPKIFYYVLGIFSWLADVDAITMDMASKSLENSLPILIATTTILIATVSNNLIKASIAYRFGEKHYGRGVAIGFGLSMVTGGVALIAMNLMV